MQSLFIHLPLSPTQAKDAEGQEAGTPLSSELAAYGVRLILSKLAQTQELA